MILDKLLQFDPALTAASAIVTGGVDSTNILDLGAQRDLSIVGGDDIDLVIVFTIGTVFAASGGASSLTIKCLGAPDSSGSPGTFRILSQTDAIPKANLTANSVIKMRLPPQAGNPLLTVPPRYLKLTYVATTNNFTSGDFECDLVAQPQANTPPYYAAGVTVAN